MSSKSVADLLQSHNDILTLTDKNRIRCSVTGHEMPPNFDVITAHLNGKDFKKKKEWYNADYSPYLPYIVPHKDSDKMLYCTLTGISLNKIPNEVQKHVNGKKFKR